MSTRAQTTTRSIHPVAVIGTFAWRMLIAAAAFWGWWIYGHDVGELMFLTQSSNLLAAVVFAVVALWGLAVGLVAHKEPPTRFPRGAITLLLLVVGGSYLGLMGGDVSETRDLMTHVVTPALLLVDWCAVGRSQHDTRWWEPPLWLTVPLLWLGWYVASDGFRGQNWGAPLYDFLDPADGSFSGVVLRMLAGALMLAYLLYGVAKLEGAVSRSIRATPTGQVGSPPSYPAAPMAPPPVVPQGAPSYPPPPASPPVARPAPVRPPPPPPPPQAPGDRGRPPARREQ